MDTNEVMVMPTGSVMTDGSKRFFGDILKSDRDLFYLKPILDAIDSNRNALSIYKKDESEAELMIGELEPLKKSEINQEVLEKLSSKTHSMEKMLTRAVQCWLVIEMHVSLFYTCERISDIRAYSEYKIMMRQAKALKLSIERSLQTMTSCGACLLLNQLDEEGRLDILHENIKGISESISDINKYLPGIIL